MEKKVTGIPRYIRRQSAHVDKCNLSCFSCYIEGQKHYRESLVWLGAVAQWPPLEKVFKTLDSGRNNILEFSVTSSGKD